MIEVRGLRKRFGDVVAVDEVSFEARNGEVTALLGENGAGKTTTLRSIYGLIQPDAGEVRVDGVDGIAQPLSARMGLGVLSEARGLYPRLTPREHMRYFAHLQGLGRAETETRCDDLVDLLGMQDFADRRAAGLSHGENTKVALARALLHDPANILLDEPTTGLDVMSTRAVRELIVQLRARGKCVVFSSHVMQEVAAVSDRIVVVSAGRVVASGTPAELRRSTGLDDLEDVFVALAGSGGAQE
ncbi:MAG: ATP-binding cassette domain-containing protein [Acidobacteriia bacterium]|nr:ATP-binding cassette domain-containing protein [Terriglobia bacterium]MYG02066.1 ATP-binding cassette domain-containing protein [Terriglobia bacterium]MYK09985.1 ATP-binding cassette domain-containing protein [Terriglobia bacterium]